jgi:uncharacterized protein (TIGR02145 family)
MKRIDGVKQIILLCVLAVLTSCGSKQVADVQIGEQVWAGHNLNSVTFNNGDKIEEAQTKEAWEAAGHNKVPAWCYYEGDAKNGEKYGILYNWYVVNDPRGIAPEGWKVPTKEDWEMLALTLGGSDVAGKEMKSTEGWKDSTNGTNSSGFNGLPAGYRTATGAFAFLGEVTGWMTTTESNEDYAWGVANIHTNDRLDFIAGLKSDGVAIRLIKK